MAQTGRPKTRRGKVLNMHSSDRETLETNTEAPPIDAPVERTTETAPASEEIKPADDTAKPLPAFKQRSPTFWNRVAAIPKADWGTRAFIYIYCLEPICNLKLGGETKYLVRLQRPLEDENEILVDYGSGKYRLQLVHRKPAADRSDAIDSIEIDIYNPNYPSKIPQSVWMNDPRNAKYAALIPKEVPKPEPTGLGTVTEAFKTFTEMRKEMTAEMKPPTDQGEANPFAMAKQILEIQNGANNPMVALFTQQMQMFQKEAEQSRTREAELQRELREQLRAARDTGPGKSAMEMLKETIESVKELLPTIKGIVPDAAQAVQSVTRGPRREWWQELLIDAAPGTLEFLKPIAMAIAVKMNQAPAGPPGPAAPRSNTAAPAAPSTAPAIAASPQEETAETRIIQFLRQPFAWNTLKAYFTDFVAGKPNAPDGAGYASWVAEGQPEVLTDARAVGTDRLLSILRTAPEWPTMQPYEAKLREFIDGILTWLPEEDEPETDDAVTDLTGAPLSEQ